MAEIASAKRLDHHGIVAGVIKDLQLIEAIDDLLGSSGCEEVSEGEAIAAMIINGLGFTDRPLSLSPQFFEQVPVEDLFRDGIEASHFNRHKLSRALEKVHSYGSSNFFQVLASKAASQEGLKEAAGISLDTTSFSVTGKKYADTDENEVRITHGFSKDHRPDLPQIVQELIVSHDAGVPLFMCCHSGNASDSVVFKERCKSLKSSMNFKQLNRTLVADSKIYCKANSNNLSEMMFVTRIPETLLEARDTLKTACKNDEWERYGADHYYQNFRRSHYGIDQSWIVVYSDQGIVRATKSLETLISKERAKIDKEIFHLQANEFSCSDDTIKALNSIAKKWKHHQVKASNTEKIARYAKAGKPKTGCEQDRYVYKVSVQTEELPIEKKNSIIKEKACFILGTNNQTLSPPDTIKMYKAQGGVERGFRFLKDPLFFTSSFFLKKPERIEGLVTVMTLALMVYSIAQRRLRQALKKMNETVPNQIGKPVKNPTMRWVFQMFFGINIIDINLGYAAKRVIQGIGELHWRILKHTSLKAFNIYNACNSTS